MKKIREIFWKYFLEKKWGRLWGLKEPKSDDKLGIKLFSVMNLIGFVMIIVMIGIFIYLFFIGRFLNESNILWPILIGLLLIGGGGVWNIIGVVYYIHLRQRWSVTLHMVGFIVSLFFTYYFFIRELK